MTAVALPCLLLEGSSYRLFDRFRPLLLDYIVVVRARSFRFFGFGKKRHRGLVSDSRRQAKLSSRYILMSVMICDSFS